MAGIVYLSESYPDVTPTSTGWQDVNISSYVSGTVVGAIVRVYCSSASAFGWRNNESTDSTTGTMSAGTQFVFTVGVSSNYFEVYQQALNFTIELLGYITTEGGYFRTNASSYTPTEDAWTDIDLTGEIQGSDVIVGACFKIYTGSATHEAILRKNGSTDNRTNRIYQLSAQVIGLGSGDICEGYRGNTADVFYFLGYIKDSYATFDANSTEYTLSGAGSYYDFNSALPTGALGGFWDVENTATGALAYAIRVNGGSDDSYYDCYATASLTYHCGYIMKCDGSRISEGKSENTTSINFWLNGYSLSGSISGEVTATCGAATASTTAPTLSWGSTVSPTCAGSNADAITPTVGVGGNVTATCGAADAAAIAPEVTGQSSGVSAHCCEAEASAIAPTLSWVSPSCASATASTVKPTVGGGGSASPTCAASTASAIAPTLSWGSKVSPTCADAVASMPVPLIEAPTIHHKHIWSVAPSENALFTLACFENLAKQYDDFETDMAVVSMSRTVASSTSRWKDVVDYTCDGTADEVQINLAIDDCAAKGGGTVLLLEGTFTLAAGIQLKNNVSLVGYGPKTILSSSAITNTNHDTETGNVGIMLRDLTLSAGAFHFYNCKGFPVVNIQKVLFTNGAQLLLDDCGHVRIDGCTFNAATTFTDSTFITVFNSSFTGDSTFALNLTGCSDCILRGNYFRGVEASFSGSKHCVTMGNTFTKGSANLVRGLQSSSCYQNLVLGNTFSDFTAAGIYATGSDNGLIVLGNTIHDGQSATGVGVQVSNTSTHVNVSGNLIYNAYTDGILGQTSGTPTTYGVFNCNTLYKCRYNGINMANMQRSIVAANAANWNGTATDNTYSNIKIGGGDNNCVIGNSCFKGDSAPLSKYGIYVASGSSHNMVTMNYLVNGGSTAALQNSGTSTDLKDWMTKGNRINRTECHCYCDDSTGSTIRTLRIRGLIWTFLEHVLKGVICEIWHTKDGSGHYTDAEPKSNDIGEVYVNYKPSSTGTYVWYVTFDGDDDNESSTSSGVTVVVS